MLRLSFSDTADIQSFRNQDTPSPARWILVRYKRENLHSIGRRRCGSSRLYRISIGDVQGLRNDGLQTKRVIPTPPTQVVFATPRKKRCASCFHLYRSSRHVCKPVGHHQELLPRNAELFQSLLRHAGHSESASRSCSSNTPLYKSVQYPRGSHICHADQQRPTCACACSACLNNSPKPTNRSGTEGGATPPSSPPLVPCARRNRTSKRPIASKHLV